MRALGKRRTLQFIAHRRGAVSVLTGLAVACLAAGCARNSPQSISTGQPTAGHADQCFNINGLTNAQQHLARTLLLRAMDSEALYTIAGPIKSTSSGFADLRLRVRPTVDTRVVDSLAAYTTVLPALSCGNIGAELSVYGAALPEGPDTSVRVRYVSLTMVNRDALRRTIQQHAAFFSTLAIVPVSHPLSVLGAVEHAERSARWRGYGYLFGYPDVAVDFFVRSGEKGDSIDALARAAGRTGTYIEPRDFRFIETFHKTAECQTCAPTRPTFIYAVAKGAALSAGDKALRASTAPIYAAYAKRRARFVTAERNGIVELLREWNAENWRSHP